MEACGSGHKEACAGAGPAASEAETNSRIVRSDTGRNGAADQAVPSQIGFQAQTDADRPVVTRDDKESFVSFDGARIAYDDTGEGPAVILLHGLAADRRMFGPLDRLRSALEAIGTSIGELGVQATPHVPAEGRRGLSARLGEIGARVIAPDLRGHGASDKPHDPAAYAHGAMARDAVALADHLRLDRFDVLGYSFGAIAAAKLLALGDARVMSAVLAGIGKEVLKGEVMALSEAHPAARLHEPLTMRAYSQYVADALARGDAAPGSPGASYRILARAMGNDVEALAAVLRGDGAEQVPAAALQRVRVPVLLLNGSNDPASLTAGRLMDVLPNARAVTCDGDHLSAPWQPTFHRAVLDFLTEQWGAGPDASRPRP
jgi:pimeloyl-ACP methyl ester carboxylesterase